MFINGKAYGSLRLSDKNENITALRLLANNSNCEALEIDELRLLPRVIYKQDFTPARVLKFTKDTLLYIPFEKIISGKIS